MLSDQEFETITRAEQCFAKFNIDLALHVSHRNQSSAQIINIDEIESLLEGTIQIKYALHELRSSLKLARGRVNSSMPVGDEKRRKEQRAHE